MYTKIMKWQYLIKSFSHPPFENTWKSMVIIIAKAVTRIMKTGESVTKQSYT